MAKTIHVYPSTRGDWVVRKEGQSGKVFATQKEAVQAAKQSVKNEAVNQLVVFGKRWSYSRATPVRRQSYSGPSQKGPFHRFAHRAGCEQSGIGAATIRISSSP